MNAHEPRTSETAAALRVAFDATFSRASDTDVASGEKLLAVGLGSHSYLVRLAEVSGVFADKTITWLPSHVSELLGLAGLRGAVLPVYDLGMLLGSPRAPASRWLLVTGSPPVGFAFGRFDGYLSVRPEDIVREIRAEARERHVVEVVRTAGLARPLVSLASVVESIGRFASHDSSEKEPSR